MNWSMPNSLYLLRFLPMGASIIMPKNLNGDFSIHMGDLDGDEIPEIVIPYRYINKNYLLILKFYRGFWNKMANIQGEGYDINYLKLEDVTGDNKKDIIVGWQFGSIWSKLNILSLSNKSIKNIVKDNIMYSKIDVFNRKKDINKEKTYLALWNHDTGEAYKIEVLSYNSKELIADEKIYPYYFKRVVDYYEEKVREMPDAAFYWYYLADAQIKANMPNSALKSIELGMNLNLEYPSEDDFNKLKKKALSELQNREVSLYPAAVNTVKGLKWGYIDKSGKFEIDYIYDQAMDFQDNKLAVVTIDGMSGIIDASGKYIVKPKYNYIGEFSDNRAIVNDSKEFKVIDEKGTVLFKSDNYIGYYQDGVAVFADLDKNSQWIYGYVDKQGKIIIKPQYKSAGNFKKGRAVIQIDDNEYAIINKSGEILKSFNHPFVGDINEGLLPFKEKMDGNFGFIDESGNIVIPPRFTGIEGFNNSRAVVNESEDFSNKYGLINKKGEYVIKPQYNDIYQLGENRVAVGVVIDKNNPFMGSKYAIADTEGKLLIDFIYYGVSKYENELASAYDDKNTFFINKLGKKADKLPIISGMGTLYMKKELIKADIDKRTLYLSLSGKVIYMQNTDIFLKDTYVVKEVKYKPNINYLVYYPQIDGMEDKKAQVQVNKKLRDASGFKNISSSENLDYSYQEDFEIEFFKKNLLVLNLIGYEYKFGAAHGMPTMDYIHLDLKSGRFYQLSNLFKKSSDYVKILSSIIKDQIINQKDSPIWIESYKGISENQPFYLTDNYINIYFEPYEIAPYAAGFPTFTILFKDIMNIIDTKGSFWNSFN